MGERGQTKMYISNASLAPALAQFEKLFKNKTGFRWDGRANAHGGPGKYAFLERNYEEDEEEEEEETKEEGKGAGGSPVTVKSRLAKPLQSLMQLIFNTDIMYEMVPLPPPLI